MGKAILSICGAVMLIAVGEFFIGLGTTILIFVALTAVFLLLANRKAQQISNREWKYP